MTAQQPEDFLSLAALENLDVLPWVNYFNEHWGVLRIRHRGDWDVTAPVLVKLADASPFYHVYDYGNQLIAAPVSLVADHGRAAAYQTFDAMLGLIRTSKKWQRVVLSGAPQWVRYGWLQLTRLGLEVQNAPSEADFALQQRINRWLGEPAVAHRPAAAAVAVTA
jgi:hypothetical protein